MNTRGVFLLDIIKKVIKVFCLPIAKINEKENCNMHN